MVRRLYISRVVGDGSFGNEFRAKVKDHGVDATVILPTDPNTGLPTSAWCLAVVDTPNHAPLLADADLDGLPDFPFDAKMNAMQTQTKRRMEQALARRGIQIDLANMDGYRDMIRALGRTLEPGFDENNFDVARG